MAKNPPSGDNRRQGAIKKRSQFKHPNGRWIKRDKATGQIMDVKADKDKFKGVSKEK